MGGMVALQRVSPAPDPSSRRHAFLNFSDLEATDRDAECRLRTDRYAHSTPAPFAGTNSVKEKEPVHVRVRLLQLSRQLGVGVLMARRLRHIPPGGALVEVTTRTVHSRYLIRPTAWVNEIIVGILARAQRRAPKVRLCALVFLSNHYHLLLWAPDSKELCDFMQFVNSNIAREIGKLIGWQERFWSRRYQHVIVSAEPEAQVERLRYILSHGVKEDLVHRPEDWPGVHGIRSLLYGKPLRGYWFDRTAEHQARQRREQYERLTHATPEVLRLDPLPCWRHLSVEVRRSRVRELLCEIEAEHRERRGRERKGVLGVNGVKSRDPLEFPRKSKKSLAPLVHAASRKVRIELKRAYAAFYQAFREAATELRRGNRDASFPEGSFPPALPYVSHPELARPQPA